MVTALNPCKMDFFRMKGGVCRDGSEVMDGKRRTWGSPRRGDPPDEGAAASSHLTSDPPSNEQISPLPHSSYFSPPLDAVM